METTLRHRADSWLATEPRSLNPVAGLTYICSMVHGWMGFGDNSQNEGTLARQGRISGRRVIRYARTAAERTEKVDRRLQVRLPRVPYAGTRRRTSGAAAPEYRSYFCAAIAGGSYAVTRQFVVCAAMWRARRTRPNR
jgi:hypothetical protein